MGLFGNLKILSLEQATVVPYLTYRLAMDGMQVIRLEHPVYGDPNRMIGANVLGEERMNSYFLCINAGKQALTLNLAEPDGQELLTRLVRDLQIDIFVTNQLPRNYVKLGIDYERLRAVKPDIIWLGVTGFGPDSNEGAYDPVLQARSGLMEMTGEAGEPPQAIGIPLPDMGTSEHAYGLLMKALFTRQVSGRGQRIDLAMFESSTSWLTVPVTLTATFGQKTTRKGNTHEFFCPVSVYPTADGFVYLAVGNDRQWQAMVAQPLFASLDRPAYATNQGRIADVAALNRAIAAITREQPTDTLLALFNAITVPVSRINTIPDMLADPLIQRRLLKAVDARTGLRLTLAPPPYLTPHLEAHDRTLAFPPRFGEHNREIYRRLGLSDTELDGLAARGII